MPGIDELSTKLKAARRQATPTEAADFGCTLDELGRRSGEISDDQLRDLFGAFDDRTGNLDGTWSLLHLVESFEVDRFVQAFVDSLESMDNQGAKEWIAKLTFRLLNDPPNDQRFLDAVKNGPPGVRDVVKKVLSAAAAGGGPAGTKARDVLDELR